MIVTIIIISSLLLASLYVNYNLFRKLEILEEEIEKNLAIFTGIYSTIKEIDSTGAFESDDEVGSVFGDLKSIIERNEKLLNSEFGKEEENYFWEGRKKIHVTLPNKRRQQYLPIIIQTPNEKKTDCLETISTILFIS